MIGNPDSWPHYLHGEKPVTVGISGAVIAEVALTDDGIALATEGAVCGPTYLSITIEDPSLRARVYAAMRVGAMVDAVAASVI